MILFDRLKDTSLTLNVANSLDRQIGIVGVVQSSDSGVGHESRSEDSFLCQLLAQRNHALPDVHLFVFLTLHHLLDDLLLRYWSEC